MHPSRHAVARLGSVAIEWIVLYVLWLLYVGQLSPSELITGALAAILAAVASEAVRGQNLARFYPATHWVFLLGRLPLDVLRDCGRLTQALFRSLFLSTPPASNFREIEFPGGGDDARSDARRALAGGALSLPPNSYVIGIDRERNRILLHNLIPAHDAEVMADALTRH
jgi:multisubunit Na+/H+ antiporter MnhE subunit